MKLTKAMRETFVEKVMKAVPMRSTDTREKCIEAIEKLARDMLPDEIKLVMRTWPESIKMTSEYLDEFNGMTPTGYVHGRAVHVGGFFPEEKAYEHIVARYHAYLAELEARDEMKARLWEVARACTTTEKLIDALPELKSFVPLSEVTVKHLPVAASQLCSDLKALGLEVTA